MNLASDSSNCLGVLLLRMTRLILLPAFKHMVYWNICHIKINFVQSKASLL
ncbi:hypothetical protein IscW_ISCW002142 [Ixodes scapularis]|uniref:Uncharacterized protein n=1 Tax=Ixodes scapularis TaxID=6945 RepID=B7PAB1_IXOSC|nr:hypothetical protein IscW_ISCW002142 [Ixodes scapularis]|eukprot:XP_002406681.1 hypothetical protein IscW_ISCW002142 [Ixodes scapularis]